MLTWWVNHIINGLVAWFDMWWRVFMLGARQTLCPLIQAVAPPLHSALKEIASQRVGQIALERRGVIGSVEAGTLRPFSRIAFRWLPAVRFLPGVFVALTLIYLVQTLIPVYLAYRDYTARTKQEQLQRALAQSNQIYSTGGYISGQAAVGSPPTIGSRGVAPRAAHTGFSHEPLTPLDAAAAALPRPGADRSRSCCRGRVGYRPRSTRRGRGRCRARPRGRAPCLRRARWW